MKHAPIRAAGDLPPYIITQSSVAGEGVYERQERRVGKSHYRYADYLAEGRAWAARLGVPDIALAEHAGAYTAVHCPPSKMPGGRNFEGKTL